MWSTECRFNAITQNIIAQMLSTGGAGTFDWIITASLVAIFKIQISQGSAVMHLRRGRNFCNGSQSIFLEIQ